MHACMQHMQAWHIGVGSVCGCLPGGVLTCLLHFCCCCCWACYKCICSPGPFSVTSKHDDKIAESGLFEFAPIFVPSGAEAVSEVRWSVAGSAVQIAQL